MDEPNVINYRSLSAYFKNICMFQQLVIYPHVVLISNMLLNFLSIRVVFTLYGQNNVNWTY
jgi:hypothetical protein